MLPSLCYLYRPYTKSFSLRNVKLVYVQAPVRCRSPNLWQGCSLSCTVCKSRTRLCSQSVQNETFILSFLSAKRYHRRQESQSETVSRRNVGDSIQSTIALSCLSFEITCKRDQTIAVPSLTFDKDAT